MNNRKKVTYVVLMLFALLTGVLSGCQKEQQAVEDVVPETVYPLTITDQLGRVVTIEAEPQRIISLAPSNTEIIYSLGLDDRLVGVTTYCNYPEDALNKPKVGGFSTIDVEMVSEAHPDVIIAANIHAGKAIPQLESLGFVVVAVSPDDIGEVIEAIELVGRVANVNDVAQPLVKGFRDRIQAVAGKIATLSQAQKTTTFYIVWHDPLQTIGSTSFIHSLVETAGGINIAGEIGEKYPKISLETVIGKNPQVIIAQIGMGTGEDGPLVYAQTETLLADTDARKNGQIFGVISDEVGRPGPRIVDALEQLAKMLHPDLFR